MASSISDFAGGVVSSLVNLKPVIISRLVEHGFSQQEAAAMAEQKWVQDIASNVVKGKPVPEGMKNTTPADVQSYRDKSSAAQVSMPDYLRSEFTGVPFKGEAKYESGLGTKDVGGILSALNPATGPAAQSATTFQQGAQQPPAVVGGGLQAPKSTTFPVDAAPAPLPALPFERTPESFFGNVPRSPAVPMSPKDWDTAIRTTYGEAAGGGPAEMAAVGETLKTRALETGRSVSDIATQHNARGTYQFEPYMRPAAREKMANMSPEKMSEIRSIIEPVMTGQAPNQVPGGSDFFLAPGAMKARGDPLPAWAVRDAPQIGRQTFQHGTRQGIPFGPITPTMLGTPEMQTALPPGGPGIDIGGQNAMTAQPPGPLPAPKPETYFPPSGAMPVSAPAAPPPVAAAPPPAPPPPLPARPPAPAAAPPPPLPSRTPAFPQHPIGSTGTVRIGADGTVMRVPPPGAAAAVGPMARAQAQAFGAPPMPSASGTARFAPPMTPPSRNPLGPGRYGPTPPVPSVNPRRDLIPNVTGGMPQMPMPSAIGQAQIAPGMSVTGSASGGTPWGTGPAYGSAQIAPRPGVPPMLAPLIGRSPIPSPQIMSPLPQGGMPNFSAFAKPQAMPPLPYMPNRMSMQPPGLQGTSTMNRMPTTMQQLPGGLAASPFGPGGMGGMAGPVNPASRVSLTAGGTPQMGGRTSAGLSTSQGQAPTASMGAQQAAASKSAIANVLVAQLDAAMHAQEATHGDVYANRQLAHQNIPAPKYSILQMPKRVPFPTSFRPPGY